MASSLVLKKLTTSAVSIRHLTNSSRTFRQSTAPKVLTGSSIALGQSSASNVITGSGVTFRQPEASRLHSSDDSPANASRSFRTSTRFTRSVVPVRPPAATGAPISRLMLLKEFHVHVSHDDSVIRIVLRRLFEALDPRGWWYLSVALDAEKLEVDVKKRLFGIKRVVTDEGVAFQLRFMPGVDSRDMKVSLEDNELRCEGIRAAGHIHKFRFLLPKRTYQPSDVKAKVEKEVLVVTFTNLTTDDLDDASQY